MTSCDRCGGRSIVLIRYSGAHLCGRHFCEFVEKRVKHEFRRQMNLTGSDRMAIAVSGGKDSTVALHITHKILGERRGSEICGITVDEGITGYRDSSIPIVQRSCKALGIQHIVVSFEQLYGITMDRIASSRRELATCSYCGVLRRAAMNRSARDWGANYLVTGLNLDDTAQSILMNFARGDMERLARLGPHRRVQKGLIPRVQPLRTIPESESTLYAVLNDLEFHDLECPYAPEALRNQYRTVVAQLEDKSPGTRHAILRSYDEILPALEKKCPPRNLRGCACGEPTISEKCRACELLVELRSGSAI